MTTSTVHPTYFSGVVTYSTCLLIFRHAEVLVFEFEEPTLKVEFELIDWRQGRPRTAGQVLDSGHRIASHRNSLQDDSPENWGAPRGHGGGGGFRQGMGACLQKRGEAHRVNHVCLKVHDGKVQARSDPQEERNDHPDQSRLSQPSPCSPTASSVPQMDDFAVWPNFSFWS